MRRRALNSHSGSLYSYFFERRDLGESSWRSLRCPCSRRAVKDGRPTHFEVAARQLLQGQCESWPLTLPVLTERIHWESGSRRKTAFQECRYVVIAGCFGILTKLAHYFDDNLLLLVPVGNRLLAAIAGCRDSHRQCIDGVFENRFLNQWLGIIRRVGEYTRVDRVGRRQVVGRVFLW